ncbi:MAG: hypothetical protein ACLP01_19430 [Solirubrobacteraceae bacterium]
MLAVDPRFRGAGIGAALVCACQGDGWAPASRGLVASSAIDMTTAHCL